MSATVFSLCGTQWPVKMRESDPIIQICIDISLPAHDINGNQICSWELLRDGVSI